MLAVNNNCNTTNITPIENKQNNLYQLASYKNNADTVSFKGLSVKTLKNTEEINEVVNLFYDALLHNLEPNKKSRGFLSKVSKFISTLPFKSVAKQPNSITEGIESNGKLAGGYCMNLDMKNSTAHIGFVTLNPEFMRTRTGIDILKTIGKRICANLELNHIQDITWSTSSKNKPINRLLKKIDAKPIRRIGPETEYKISIDDLKSNLAKL